MDYHVAFRYNLSQEFALALVKCLVLRPRVPARIFGILSLDGKLAEASAEALHLLFRRRTQHVRRSDRATPPGRSNRLQTSDARSNHENASGRNRSGSRRHHRKTAGPTLRAKSNACE